MSHQGFTGTFKEFKDRFYSTIGDGTCLNVLDINLLKVILDGLKIRYSSRGKVSHFFDKHFIVMYVYLFRNIIFDFFKRRALKKKIIKSKKSNVLIGFSNRYVEENFKNYPLYFQKIFNEFGRENFCYVTEGKSKVSADFDFNDLTVGFNFLSLRNITLYFKIRKLLKDIKHKWTQIEFLDIQIACFLFYINYLKWEYFFTHKKISVAIIEQHYHREGFILACKKRGIIVNELQHGLIAEEDIFYVMPQQVSEVISKALFPDNIFVYGIYWKNMLLKGCEFKEKQIKELGFYHYESATIRNIKTTDCATKKQILITTQYSAEKYYIDYVKKISPLLTDEWQIIIKPHPVEDEKIYMDLEELHNVSIVQGNLNMLINNCEFLISIFSTTIFDAVRLGKPAFALYFPIFADYVNGIIASKAAYPLNFDDDPVNVYEEIALTTKDNVQNDFYTAFNKKMFMNIFLETK
ncbi:MAG: hypothetical protein ABI315_09380 [Bacteroidia bacterium]